MGKHGNLSPPAEQPKNAASPISAAPANPSSSAPGGEAISSAPDNSRVEFWRRTLALKLAIRSAEYLRAGTQGELLKRAEHFRRYLAGEDNPLTPPAQPMQEGDIAHVSDTEGA